MNHPPTSRLVHRLVGDRIQRLRLGRQPRRWTQQQLADHTQGALSRSSIANVERGRQGLSLVQLMTLAEALGAQPADLLPRREEVFDVKKHKSSSLPRSLGQKERTWVERV